MMMTAQATAFRHEALLYSGGLDGFARELAPMVSETLGEGGNVAIAAPADRVARIASLFGPHERLELIDMTGVGGNPARIIPAWREIADRAHAAGGPFLGVGEPIWAGRSHAEIDECHRHEALINIAFRDDPAWRLVCPYDADRLAATVLDDARTTHPTVHEPIGSSSRKIDGPAAFAAFERPLAPAPSDAISIDFGIDDLATLRALAASVGGAAGLSARRIEDLTLAVSELASNGIRHGNPPRRLAIWHSMGVVICQATNLGRIGDVLVGRVRPSPDQLSGRGVWIMHQLCDLVQIRSLEGKVLVRVMVS